jgi:O-antigen/teichoic acid export membrane protein
VLLGSLGASLIFIALAFIFSRIIGLVIAFGAVGKILKGVKFSLHFAGFREIWPKVRIFGLHFVFGNLFFQLDTLLLAVWRGDGDVGVYQSAWKIIALAVVIPEVLINPLLPVLTRLHHTDQNGWYSLGRLLNKTLLFIGMPLAFISFAYADQIINIIYGENVFTDAVMVLRFFAFIILIRFGVETFALLLTTSGRQETRMWIVILGTIFNIFLNLFFIPEYGPVGAAIVSLITNACVGVAYMFFASRNVAHWLFDRRMIIPILIAIALGVIAWEVRAVPVWYAAPILFCVYAGSVLYSGYGRSELKLIFARN